VHPDPAADHHGLTIHPGLKVTTLTPRCGKALL
jgi:hypothetical protein